MIVYSLKDNFSVKKCHNDVIIFNSTYIIHYLKSNIIINFNSMKSPCIHSFKAKEV